MTQQPKKKTKKPLGPGIAWADEDLDTLSSISPTDLKAAAALWEAESPKPLQGLLKAQIEEEDNTQ